MGFLFAGAQFFFVFLFFLALLFVFVHSWLAFGSRHSGVLPGFGLSCSDCVSCGLFGGRHLCGFFLVLLEI